jgi:hypothetical protein
LIDWHGVLTIVGQRFARENDEKLQSNLQAFFPTFSAGRWLGVRLDFIGNLSVCFAATLVVIQVYLLRCAVLCCIVLCWPVCACLLDAI